MDEFEDWQQQGHSDTVGAREGDLSDSGSSRNGMPYHRPCLGLSSSGSGHARDLASAWAIKGKRGRPRTRSSATVTPPPSPGNEESLTVKTEIDGDDVAQISSVQSLHQRLKYDRSQQAAIAAVHSQAAITTAAI